MKSIKESDDDCNPNLDVMNENVTKLEDAITFLSATRRLSKLKKESDWSSSQTRKDTENISGVRGLIYNHRYQ